MPSWRGCRSCGAAEHQAADLFEFRLSRAHFAGPPAAVEDDDTVGQGNQFFELLRYHQHGAAAVTEVEQALMDEGDAMDVDAARRLAGQKHLRLSVELARDGNALLVAAGEAGGR